MAHPYHHALSSVQKWGGIPEDYIAIHEFFDASKEFFGDFRHRMLRHHAQGIFECERQFGAVTTISTGRKIPTRWIGEQHVMEDMGRIPSLTEWLACVNPQPWMNKSRKLSRELEEQNEQATSANVGEEV